MITAHCPKKISRDCATLNGRSGPPEAGCSDFAFLVKSAVRGDLAQLVRATES
jgi:hypothetical protein